MKHFNIILALCNGIKFTRHGWVLPNGQEVKVLDNDDYQDLKEEIDFSNLLKIELKLGFTFEFTKMRLNYILIDMINNQGVSIKDRDLHSEDYEDFLNQVAEMLIEKVNFTSYIEDFKNEYPHHYQALLK